MDKLLFLIDPAPDAVRTAADLILTLLTQRCPGVPRPASVCVRTNTDTGQIEIVAEYPPAALRAAARRILNFALPRLGQVRRRRCYAGVSVRKN